jgi:anaphase-promoting complex subunit 1
MHRFLSRKILATGNCIDIKQRSGCLSYLDDPTQSKSLLAQTLTSEQYTSWKISTKNLLSFSNDKNIVNFTNKLLMGPSKVATDGLDYIDDDDIQQNLMLEAYNCLIHDKMHALPIYISLMTVRFDKTF